MSWVKKIVLLILTVFFATTITFIVIRVMPGDPVQTMAMQFVREEGLDYANAYNRAKSELAFDPSISVPAQYLMYLQNLSQGKLGQSMVYRKPTSEIVAAALPWTLFVFSSALLASFLLGILIGMFIAWKRKTILDPILSVFTSITSSIPNYIVAFLFIIVFSVNLQWFPSRGAWDSGIQPGWTWEYISSVLFHAVLPITSYIFASVGMWAMNMKANAVGILGEDYITAARIRGLSNRRIITGYVGRNALLPLVTQLAISFAMVFGGSPLIENMFMYPGVGYYLNQALSRRDYTLMQGMFLTITVAVVLANLLAELLNDVLDPRLRSQR
jgi:peptide/nickel transport system permease protein